LRIRDPKSRALPLGHAPKTFSPLASPEAPARLARQSHFTARLAGGTGSARTPKPFHRSPRRRHRLGSHANNHFTARLAGGTGSARTPKAISPLASPEAPARLAPPKPPHRPPRRRHPLGPPAPRPFTPRPARPPRPRPPPPPPSP